MKLSEALRQSEMKFRAIAETAIDCIFLKNAQRQYTYANKAMQNLLGLEEADILGKRPEEIFDQTSAEKIREVDDGTFRGNVISEVRPVTVQGIERSFHTIQVPLSDGQGDVQEICGIVRDVTEQKKFEDQLQASLREKEILLKEVNHRVNNNLQIISSIISMQSRTVSSPQARNILLDVQARINSIGMIHKQLYEADNSAMVSFGSYVNALMVSLINTYNRPEILVEICCEGVIIPVSDAIPLAIVINEIATNTIKHAYPGGQSGAITVTCVREADHISLVVGDTGVGCEATVNPMRPEGLGMHIIREMITRLNGTMTVIHHPGTRYQFRIPHIATDDPDEPADPDSGGGGLS